MEGKGGKEGQREKLTKKRWSVRRFEWSLCHRHTMLVSVPLLFLHVKKFLSSSEGPAGPERGREKGSDKSNRNNREASVGIR